MKYSLKMKGIRSYFRRSRLPRKLKKGARKIRLADFEEGRLYSENDFVSFTQKSFFVVIRGYKRTKWVNRALYKCNKMAEAWINIPRQGTSSIGRPHYDRYLGH